jgi:hypothetical protein
LATKARYEGGRLVRPYLYKLTKRELAQYAERDALIAVLGMATEDRSSYDSRYAATTGELRCDARELGVGWLVPGWEAFL